MSLRLLIDRPAISVAFLLGCLLAWSAPPLMAKQMTELRVMVQDEDGDPVARASIVLGKIKGGEKGLDRPRVKIKGQTLQLKTGQQGDAPLPPLEQGWYVIQVISSGYQTFGDRIELTDPEQTLTITLKPPQTQFSVHEKP